eukprot:COSAG01_NODE_927_length_12693_cov_16.333810_3_plen_367_part_00
MGCRRYQRGAPALLAMPCSCGGGVLLRRHAALVVSRCVGHVQPDPASVEWMVAELQRWARRILVAIATRPLDAGASGGGGSGGDSALVAHVTQIKLRKLLPAACARYHRRRLATARVGQPACALAADGVCAQPQLITEAAGGAVNMLGQQRPQQEEAQQTAPANLSAAVVPRPTSILPACPLPKQPAAPLSDARRRGAAVAAEVGSGAGGSDNDEPPWLRGFVEFADTRTSGMTLGEYRKFSRARETLLCDTKSREVVRLFEQWLQCESCFVAHVRRHGPSYYSKWRTHAWRVADWKPSQCRFCTHRATGASAAAPAGMTPTSDVGRPVPTTLRRNVRTARTAGVGWAWPRAQRVPSPLSTAASAR